MEEVVGALTKPLCLPNGKNHMAGIGPPPNYDPWTINVRPPPAALHVDPPGADVPQKAFVAGQLAQLAMKSSVGHGDVNPEELSFKDQLEMKWLRLQLTLDVPGFPILFSLGGLSAAVIVSYFYLF